MRSSARALAEEINAARIRAKSQGGETSRLQDSQAIHENSAATSKARMVDNIHLQQKTLHVNPAAEGPAHTAIQNQEGRPESPAMEDPRRTISVKTIQRWRQALWLQLRKI